MKKDRQGVRKIDEPHYSIWQALGMSFYSSRLYVDVYKRWQGLGIRYLLIMTLLFTLPPSLKIIVALDRFYVQDILHPLQAIPPTPIENGLVQFDQPMPWVQKNARGQAELIIDTTGEIQGFDVQQYPDLRILIRENSLSVYFPFDKALPELGMVEPVSGEIIFPPDVTGTLTGDMIMESAHITLLRWLAAIVAWPMIFTLIFGIYLFLILMVSMMGQLAAQVIFRFSLSYTQSVRLMMVAVTPQLFLTLFSITTGWLRKPAGLLAIILIAVYFSYAVLVNKRAGNKLVRQ
ncbi:MAG: DUF1189 family protein [Legionellaceae bacterium]|nr:DUF1189 family protein [Legionellaceae bacterium]